MLAQVTALLVCLCSPPGSKAEFSSPGSANRTPTTEAANWLVSLYLYRVLCQQQSFGEATDQCYLQSLDLRFIGNCSPSLYKSGFRGKL